GRDVRRRRDVAHQQARSRAARLRGGWRPGGVVRNGCVPAARGPGGGPVDRSDRARARQRVRRADRSGADPAGADGGQPARHPGAVPERQRRDLRQLRSVRAVAAARGRDADPVLGGARPEAPGVRRLQAGQGTRGAGRHSRVGAGPLRQSRAHRRDEARVVAPLAVATAFKGSGMVAASLAAAGAFFLSTPRSRAVCVLLALVLCPVLLVGELWNSSQLETLRGHPAELVGLAVVRLALICALAGVFLRWPLLMPILAVAALPFRIPVQAGGQSALLLVPLYVVVGGGGLAYVWERLRPRPVGAENNGYRLA